ncbi:MAG TPA: PAS domain-containing sensor histidine kinase [Prolixibacteraceae bacterium]|nr:PAS domain-containing sensor histidine kinase [Prolixibacteraceae bacterium]
MDNNQQNIQLPDNRYIALTEFYSLVIDSLQDYSILTMDKNMVINCWCAGSEKVFGYKPEEVIGKQSEIIFNKEDRKNKIPLQEVETAMKEGKASDNRWHVKKDGDLFYAYGQIFPLKDAKGELVGFVKILRDLTEKKMAEDAIGKYVKELEELNTHKENILAILSHDLRSPLGAIIEIADYLRSDMEQMNQEELRQMLDMLYQASTDELNMLDYLLEWARIKYASEVFSPHGIDLRQMVAKVFEKFQKMSDDGSVRLNNEVSEGAIVYADKNMLLSIFQNLVSNAIKYTPPRGSITVSATTEEGHVMVKVKDTGIGMTKEKMGKLFKPQVKTLAQARKEDKGAGIGLLLVKGFVERNDGQIWVESVEGQGTTFFFTLPVPKSSKKNVHVALQGNR